MKKLRSGYTTGACAAAAAKAASLLLFTGTPVVAVIIPFPQGSRVSFTISRCTLTDYQAVASVIKDAGDDPDVTNGAEILATARFSAQPDERSDCSVVINGGTGVGIVTKPGLPVAVGEPAINPVPMQMIRDAVDEALAAAHPPSGGVLEITISVPAGQELAKKTLNKRLGIIGGISILGTTGIVKPVSAAAWTGTIATSMNVASAAGLEEIIVSTGRTSERCVQTHLKLPDESLVMMGDYLEFALEESQKHHFTTIHMATMWAKLLKGAMRIPQTHVRHGALDVTRIIPFFESNRISIASIDHLKSSNTARELLERMIKRGETDAIKTVCLLAQTYYQELADTAAIRIHLVHSSGKILCSV